MAKGKRTNIEFDRHQDIVTFEGTATVHHFKTPDSFIHSVKFINIHGVLVVTGDFGNWIFCREFHPSKDGSVSDMYWIEKAQISSTQEPYRFDADTARKDIDELLSNQEDYEWSDEAREWLKELKSAAEGGRHEYFVTGWEHPGDVDMENIPSGKRTNYQLEAVFDAFDEICRRMKERADAAH